MMRILYVTPRFFPDMGGVETHVFETSRRLNAVPGVQVEVLTSDTRGSYPRTETVDGTAIHRVRAWPRQRDYRISPDIYAFVRSGGFDLVHVQGIHTAVPAEAMVAAVRNRVPYVLTPHTGGHSAAVRNRLRSMQWRALGPLVRRACRLVCVAEFERDMFINLSRVEPSRATVIPNGVEVQVAAAPYPDDPVVMSVGRFERYKGHHRLIAAMPYLLSREPATRLVLVGRGGYEQSLRSQAADLGVGAHVEFVYVPPADRAGMTRLLGRARVMALLSDYEAHPIAVMEAVANGRPVVVNATSGLAELARRGLAHPVNAPDDPAAVAAALYEQLTDPSRPTAVALPTWDDCARGLLRLYRGIERDVTPRRPSALTAQSLIADGESLGGA